MCTIVTTPFDSSVLKIIDHSKNKIITYFENEVGLVVSQSSVQQTPRTLQEFSTTRTESRHRQWPTVYAFGILAARMFVGSWIEHSKSDLGLE